MDIKVGSLMLATAVIKQNWDRTETAYAKKVHQEEERRAIWFSSAWKRKRRHLSTANPASGRLSQSVIRGLEAHRFLVFFVEPAAIKRRLSRFIKMRVNKSSAAWRQFRKKERVAARMHASKKKKRVHTAIEITRGVHTSGWLTGDPRYTDWSRTWRGKEITTMSVTILREAGLKWGTGFTQPGDSETGYVIKKSLFYWPLCWT